MVEARDIRGRLTYRFSEYLRLKQRGAAPEELSEIAVEEQRARRELISDFLSAANIQSIVYRIMVTYHQLKRNECDMMQKLIDQEKTGQYIRHLCDHAGIKVTELQKILMLDSYQSIYHWFWGESPPTVDKFYVLACTLHLPIEGLMILQDGSVSEDHIADIIKWVAGKSKNSEKLRDVYISCLDIVI